jgi:hypothetical protein
MVRTGLNRAAASRGRRAALPVTIITAMVSPMARPMPSIPAMITPERPAGTTTRQVVCQRVAPMASPASR